MKAGHSADPADAMVSADYTLPAEIFVSRRSGARRGGLTCRRFATATEAIAFAVETFATLRPDDVVMTVEDKRFNLAAIRLMHRKGALDPAA